MRRSLVLPDEDAAEFAGLEAALVEELAPVGALQTGLARRVAVAAWRLARADRIEAELFEERRRERRARARADPRRQRRGSFERCCAIAARRIAEFWRALRTLKALQADRAHNRRRDRARAARWRPDSARGAATARPVRTERTRARRGPPDRLPAERAAPPAHRHEQALSWRPNESAAAALWRRLRSSRALR